VKKIVSILLSFQVLLGSLFPNVETIQLAKIGELVSHYQEHQQAEEEDLSFVDFLIMHYSTTSKHLKNAKHSHSNLPNLDSHNSVISYCQSVFCIDFSPSSDIPQSFYEPNFHWLNLYHFSLSRILLNPPKLVLV
jgi:hypothetical protein